MLFRSRRVLLSDNFRSGGEVVEAVNQVFSCCMSQDVGGLRYGEAEALREGIPHEPLPNAGVEFYTLEAPEDANREEAAFVAGRIGEMLNRGTLVRTKEGLRPVIPEDIVILLRSQAPWERPSGRRWKRRALSLIHIFEIPS